MAGPVLVRVKLTELQKVSNNDRCRLNQVPAKLRIDRYRPNTARATSIRYSSNLEGKGGGQNFMQARTSQMEGHERKDIRREAGKTGHAAAR
jgi:hypothetical protein